MQKRVINIIDSVDAINIGIWSSILVNTALIANQGIQSALCYPRAAFQAKDVQLIPLDDLSTRSVESLIKKYSLDPVHDLVVTHGLWHYPTRWGAALKKLGFNWIFVPHGMLEPWPLQQKWLKKKIYFNLVEKRMAADANLIRAVSAPEAANLRRMFPRNRIEFIANGVKIPGPSAAMNTTPAAKTKYLFLSRLHHKKNVIALAEAWIGSTLNNSSSAELVIAGPDQGELDKLQKLIATSMNISYVGAVFGEEKHELLQQAVFYILPSFSEGLPSALLEAMSYGLIPIITEGCNFPEVFEQQLGLRITTDKESIRQGLETSARLDYGTRKDKSEKSRALIVEQYSLEAVTQKQIEIYFGL